MTIKTLGVALLALTSAVPASAAGHDYMVVVRTVDVAGSADAAWARLGDFCAIGELLPAECRIESGDGGVGTVRRLNGVTVEPLIARTPYSYTYSQVEGSRANTDYHGTLAVEPLGNERARIVYTLVIDRSRLPAGTNVIEYQKQLETRFQGVVDRAKVTVEAKQPTDRAATR
jgi:hypothetical protein